MIKLDLIIQINFQKSVAEHSVLINQLVTDDERVSEVSGIVLQLTILNLLLASIELFINCSSLDQYSTQPILEGGLASLDRKLSPQLHTCVRQKLHVDDVIKGNVNDGGWFS